ncbi:alpha/beta hydrolase [Natrinema sp. SYSU A 869]|uniref:alpha/beta fold hydrolase n=1 Tax=Natrinema sp. SYSU A 869 TaxID=2871694 RepID=UPI002106B125|nr:alpha/beta hydrolase [Natrinema sp. SYSU A 869]
MKTLVESGENEQALVLFERDIAGLPPDELDELRATPMWQKMVDAAHTLPRELQAISEYEFEPARFADMTPPTLLLSGGESPSFYKDATEAVHEALPNSRIATFEGEQHMAMHTAPDRFIDEVVTFIQETN